MTDERDQRIEPETLDAEKENVPTGDEQQEQEEQQHMAAAPSPAATTPVDESPAKAEESRQTDVEPARHDDFWTEYKDYRQRFDVVQAEFIEEPRAAVQKAETLMDEVVGHMIDALHDRMQSIHRDADGDGEIDTERLRLVMRSYRELIDSMGGDRGD